VENNMSYPIKIIKKRIKKEDLNEFLNNPFPEVVKFVVDIEKRILAVGGELHSDAAELLTEKGSDSRNLWGGNFLLKRKDWVQLSSLINIKPSQDNSLMEVKRKEVKEKMKSIINELINEK